MHLVKLQATSLKILVSLVWGPALLRCFHEMPTPPPALCVWAGLRSTPRRGQSGLTEAIDEADLHHFLVTWGLLKGYWLLEEGAAVKNLTGDGEKAPPCPGPRKDKMEVQVRDFCEDWDKRIRKPSSWLSSGPLA